MNTLFGYKDFVYIWNFYDQQRTFCIPLQEFINMVTRNFIFIKDFFYPYLSRIENGPSTDVRIFYE